MRRPQKTCIGGGVYADFEKDGRYLALTVPYGDSEDDGVMFRTLIDFEDLPKLTAYIAALTAWLAEQEKA